MKQKSLAILTVLVIFFSCSGKDPGSKEGASNLPKPVKSIYMASLQGDTLEIHRHISAGTDLNSKDAYGNTPLIIAITFNHPDAVEMLLNAGADPAATNNEGSSALHVAAFLCREDAVRQLIRHKANLHALNASGKTPFETMVLPFPMVEPLYLSIAHALAPLGLHLDLEHIAKKRPQIADILQKADRN